MLFRNPMNAIYVAAASTLALAALGLAPSMAGPLEGSDADVGTITGRAVLPEKLAEGVDGSGLSLTDATVILEGKVTYPRRPTPENWRDLTPKERSAWSDEFEKSDAFAEYTKKVAEAEAKRFRLETVVDEEGNFEFKDLDLAWYQLTVMIMHPAAKDTPSEELARAYALRQFFVKKEKPDVKLGKIRLEVKNVLMPGDMAPDFVADRFDGGEFKLSDFRGKYVLFDFWATWCGPCIKEIPNLAAASEKFGGDRFQVIGLSTDDAIDEPRAFLEKKASDYLQGHVGEKDRYAKISTDYGIRYIPSIWLIGPDGKIVARDLRGEGIEAAVKAALEAK